MSIQERTGGPGPADDGARAAGAEVPGPAEERAPRRLSGPQIFLCLAVPISIFLFGTGPIWTHPWELDRAIWWSYAPLPLLVLGCLAWSRRLTPRAWLLDTLSLTLAKFGLTFTIAIFLWGTADPPPRAAVLRSMRAAAAALEPPPAPPAPTPLPPGSTGALRGAVADASGRPVPGALVFIERGLEGVVFAPPAAPLLLDNGPLGVTPRLSAAQTWQTISARSTDGHLHTLVAASAEGPLFNVPLLSSGARTSVVVREPHGVSRIRCAVHQGGAEAGSYLAVLSHPFSAVTGDGGRFEWPGVPAGELRVAAFHPDLGDGAAPVELAAGGEAELRLALAPRPQ
ncbi:MAG: hypothetical protein IT372_09495 [Polyangiaceae bacterium]|nr:hypothetical protein [Polyangiaceae bacterium]